MAKTIDDCKYAMDSLRADAEKFSQRVDKFAARKDAESGPETRDRIRREHQEENSRGMRNVAKNPATFEHHMMQHVKPIHEKLGEAYFGGMNHSAKHANRVTNNGNRQSFTTHFGPHKIVSHLDYGPNSKGNYTLVHTAHLPGNAKGVSTSEMPPHPGKR